MYVYNDYSGLPPRFDSASLVKARWRSVDEVTSPRPSTLTDGGCYLPGLGTCFTAFRRLDVLFDFQHVGLYS